MKKITILIFVMLATAVCSYAQLPGGGTPTGNGDADLRNDSVKLRSVELERIKRQSEGGAAVLNPDIASKFKQIKEDYEALQIAQSAVVKAYTTGEKIDYALMETAVKLVNKSARRLDTNMFIERLEKKDDKSKASPKTIKEMIVDLDTAIGGFVSSKIFSNLKGIDPEVAKKAQIDLANVLEMSNKIAKEAKKMK